MEHPPQLRDMRLQGVRCSLRGVLPPQLIDQAIGGYDLVGPDEQQCQQGSTFGPAERKWLTVGPHFEWSENRNSNTAFRPYACGEDPCEARSGRQGSPEEYRGG